MSDVRVIPVFLGPERAGQPRDFASRSPVTLVHVACDADWTVNSSVPPNHDGKPYRALIDTGAEGTFIDAQIAQEIGIVATKRAIVHGFDGSKEVPGADVQIVFPTPNIVFAERAAITSLQSAGQTFHVILGRSFLRHCRFSIDGPSEHYSLCWID